MQRIRFTASVGGILFSYAPGQEVEVEDWEAGQWILAGQAEPVLEVSADPKATPDPRWELRVSPDAYLKRHPDGGYADLAREILGR